jgi:hypothetical protein
VIGSRGEATHKSGAPPTTYAGPSSPYEVVNRGFPCALAGGMLRLIWFVKNRALRPVRRARGVLDVEERSDWSDEDRSRPRGPSTAEDGSVDEAGSGMEVIDEVEDLPYVSPRSWLLTWSRGPMRF